MKSVRAVLCGYYGMGNGGDEALLASLLQMLPAHVIPVVLSGDPDQTRDRYRVEAVNRKEPMAVLNALRQSHLFIWGGGSLIQDATSALSPSYYLGLMHLAQQMGLTTIAWAQGIGPIQRSPNRWLARQIFSRCSEVSVRDLASAALLSEWKIPFTLAPDPVWAMQSAPVEGLWDLPAPRVVVNLRRHPELTPVRLAHLTQALIAFQKATQTCILLVPFQSSQDLAIATAIQPQLAGSSKILSLDNPHQLKGLFRGVEMAIAMRFHGLIMAAAEDCRCFALSYDPKVSQLMSDIAIPGWALNAIPDHPDVICQAWLEHYANGDSLTPDRIQFLRDRALIHQDVIQNVVQEK